MERFLLCIWITGCLVSCGKQDFPDYSPESNIQSQEADGSYRIELTALNRPHTGSVRSHAIIWKKGLQFYVRVVMDRGPKNVRIQQYLHAGERCPGRVDDRNGNGKIDFPEVIAVSGKMLIPLDGHLQNQAKGQEWFPSTNKKGKYYYSRAANLRWLIDDLKSQDHSPHDYVIKLRQDEDLYLSQRTLILFGSTDDPLLPLACAEIGARNFSLDDE